MKRVIISSLPNVIELIKKYPELDGVSAFSTIKVVMGQISQQKGGCSSCKAKSVISKYKGLFEGAISSMGSADKELIKRVLNTQEICYYTRNANNMLELKCVS